MSNCSGIFDSTFRRFFYGFLSYDFNVDSFDNMILVVQLLPTVCYPYGKTLGLRLLTTDTASCRKANTVNLYRLK
jgi:hypothetical protein